LKVYLIFFQKWACAKAGVAMVNINPLYTARELKYALEKVDAKLLICPKVIGPLKYHETITQMIPDLSTRDKHDLKVSSLPTLKKIVYYSTTESTDGAFTFDEFGDSADRSHHNILESITIR
jgi:acyl-CoA synthetase (AMP-forming)/AMP-acid ligase II